MSKFIVEVANVGTTDWSQSINEGLDKPFSTYKEALAALDPEKKFIGSSALKYRVIRSGAAKPHAKRFIIEVQSTITEEWRRSGNDGLYKAFPTREAAQAALDAPDSEKSRYLNYRVRQK